LVHLLQLRHQLLHSSNLIHLPPSLLHCWHCSWCLLPQLWHIHVASCISICVYKFFLRYCCWKGG
jgi:hypothetical protein